MASVATEINLPAATVFSHEDTLDTTENQYEKLQAIHIEHAAEKLNTVDFELLSRESIRFKSRATLRLLLVIFVQGISE